MAETTTYVRKSDPTQELGSFTQEELGAKLPNPGMADMTEGERLASLGYIPKATDTIFNTTSPTSVVSGSDAVRANVLQNQLGAQDLLGNINGVDTQYTIDSLKQSLGYTDPNAPFQSGEQSTIDNLARSAALEYEPLIREAEEQKRLGMPKAIIGAGERGGFENTQYAGAAALASTQGGTFVGAGGELENIKSAYDRNISDLKAKQQQAMSLARAKAEEAIRTGRSQSNKEARELFSLAQDANARVLELQKSKLDILSGVRKENEARITTNISQLGQLAKAGMAPPSDLAGSIDSIYGSGFSQKYYEAEKAASAADSVEKELDAMKKITDVLKSYPAGEEIEIGGNKYTTIGSSSDTQTFKEEDRMGNITLVTIDKRTGEIVKSVDAGQIGAGTKGTGGGSGDGTSTTPSADTLSFEDWAAKEKQMSITKSAASPDMIAEYDKYVAANSGPTYTLKQLKSATSPTDEAIMISKGMNPNDVNDLYKYVTTMKKFSKDSGSTSDPYGLGSDE